MKEDKKVLYIAEKFKSIQGEGPSMGKPAIFLRLSGCNILCQSESWICDTIEVWKKGVKTLFEDSLKEYIEDLKNGFHLVITGGEPLMHQQRILEYIEWFKNHYGFLPYIEVETNGTINPFPELTWYVQQWNVSPKLSNSGVKYNQRYFPNKLAGFRVEDAHFKFVVSDHRDVDEIIENYLPHTGNKSIWLMPAGSNQEELSKTRLFAADAAIKNGFNYSERLHVVIWNQKTGV